MPERTSDPETTRPTEEPRRPNEAEADTPIADDDSVLTEEAEGDGEADGDDLSDPEILLTDAPTAVSGADAFLHSMEVPRRSRRRPEVSDRRGSTRRDDPVKTYLREIGRVPLLTKEQEVELARAMEVGSYAELLVATRRGEMAADALDSSNPPTAARAELEDSVARGAEARELLQHVSLAEDHGINLPKDTASETLDELIAVGRAARERLTVANLRLVVSIAKRYMNRGLSFLDLIQEGNMGLMKAVEKFEYERGNKFSTYAYWWIKQAITRAIADKARLIRIPVHVGEKLKRVQRISDSLAESLGRTPTASEIARKMRMPVGKINDLLGIVQDPQSLDGATGDGELPGALYFLADPDATDPLEATLSRELKDRMRRALGVLDDREEQIIRLRFGIGHDEAHTLEEIGRKVNLSRERVRQIEGLALRKILATDDSDALDRSACQN